ncbi:LPS biosynthesis protein [Youhaiella tibetensis]|uniref:Lipopolysaccharide biosynthesis protein n=1 Tax=Paradevosia tibetensis TaxID=1447062 RepID=A0A5B9DIH5_9HYPH|nr:lipopolysaccharide biosynthesis protein [Youhaiella tibetensis]GGF36767.1 LPS biosynthesis protein [Youhaiella tibetensis]
MQSNQCLGDTLSGTDILFYLAVFWRRLPYFVGAALLVAAAGIATVMLLPPVYRASSKILVETPQISADLARSTVASDSPSQIQVITESILTTASLVNLADQFHVYEGRTNMTDFDVAQDMAKRIGVGQLPMDLRGAATFDVSFDAETPELSADVTNEIASRILSENIRQRTARAGDTLDFFKQEVDRLSASLTDLEGKILAFKNKNADALPDSLDFRRNQQSSQQERLQLLVREEATLRSRKTNLTEAFNSGAALPVSSGPQTPQERLLDQLEQTLAAQTGIYADDSPNMLAIKARIATVKAEVLAASKAANAADVKRPATDLDVELAGIDDRLAFITQEKASITADLADLSKSIAATPANEAVLNALERDYNDVKAQHSAAVSRLADASTGEQIELRSKGERLTILEPAVPPQRPYSPNRTRLGLLSIAAAIAVGAGVVALLEYLNKTIRRPVQLTRALDIEPLATIPIIRTKRERQRQRLLLTGMAVAGSIVVIALALVAVHYATGSFNGMGMGVAKI